MGTFTVPIQVGDLIRRQFIGVDVLVGTHATHTVLPTDVLVALGIAGMERMPFQTPHKGVLECEGKEVRIRMDGRERICLVVLSPEVMTPLLGATTLQLFNLAVDPTREGLISVSALLK